MARDPPERRSDRRAGRAEPRQAPRRLGRAAGCPAPEAPAARRAQVAESGRRLTGSKLLAKRPYSGGHWPEKKN